MKNQYEKAKKHGLGGWHRKRLSLGDYCTKWLTSVRFDLKESSYAKYQGQIEKYIIPVLGSYTAKTLTVLEQETFLFALLHHFALSPKTAKDIMVLLHAIVRYAGRSEPAYRVAKAVYPKVPRQEMRVLTRTEQQEFTAYLMEDMDCCKFGVLLALLTGMRIGEVCALKWADVSVKEGGIKIHATMQRVRNMDSPDTGKTQVIITAPKSEKSVRSIPMSPLVAQLCGKMRVENPEAYVLTGGVVYMEPRTLQYRLKKYTTACGLDGVHFHTLRHTFATRCMEVGMETKVLSEVLGHANTSITLDRYVHASFDIKKENMQKLSAIGM